MRTPSEESLAAIAAEAEPLRRLRAFTEWVGPGRKLTQMGRITLPTPGSWWACSAPRTRSTHDRRPDVSHHQQPGAARDHHGRRVGQGQRPGPRDRRASGPGERHASLLDRWEHAVVVESCWSPSRGCALRCGWQARAPARPRTAVARGYAHLRGVLADPASTEHDDLLAWLGWTREPTSTPTASTWNRPRPTGRSASRTPRGEDPEARDCAHAAS
jgi:hypothetical protein